jgi:hypothetical protein
MLDSIVSCYVLAPLFPQRLKHLMEHSGATAEYSYQLLTWHQGVSLERKMVLSKTFCLFLAGNIY